MDAFETVVASILQRQGFWTITGFKVELTKEEKRETGKDSRPRPEIDVLAYRARDNEVRAVECKSFLDSPGVDCDVFTGLKPKGEERYKMFCDDTLRRVVLRRLELQLVEAGLCRPNPTIRLCLAAGKIKCSSGDEAWLRQLFDKQGWILLAPSEIRSELEELQHSGYEDSVAAIVAKLLLRGRDEPSAQS
jgi:hypothetical protein